MPDDDNPRKDINGVVYTTPGQGPAPANTPVKIWEHGVEKPGYLNSDGTVTKTQQD